MSNKTPNGFSIQIPTKDKPFSGIYGKDVASPLGRIAFVNLVRPAGRPGDKPKYGVALLVPKAEGLHDKTLEQQTAHLKEIQEMCKLMIQDLWGANAAENVKKIKRGIFGDGDSPSTTGKVYEGYPGNRVINARSGMPLGHSQGWRILNEGMEVERFEGGMICRLTLQPYLNADGFSYSLRAIKLIKDDGVRFGGAPDPTGVIDHLDEAVAAASADMGNMSVV